MTVSADRGHGQSPLEQSFSVNADRVVGENAILGNIIGAGDFGPLLVASATDKRDIETPNLGIRRLDRRNVVAAVAIPTSGGQLCAGFYGLAVQAATVDLGHLGVAGKTIGILHSSGRASPKYQKSQDA